LEKTCRSDKTDISNNFVNALVLKLIGGIAIIVTLPIIAGAWFFSTSNQTFGTITMLMGVVLAMFIVPTVASSYQAGGRIEPSPD